MNDQDIEGVRRALEVLREASAGVGAPEYIEGNLRQAFGSHHQAGRLRRYAWLTGAIAASFLLAAAVKVWEPALVIAPPAFAMAAGTMPRAVPLARICSVSRAIKC